MIVKLLTRHDASYASLIRYIQKNSKDGKFITHNLRSADVEGYTREFLENQANRKHPRKGQIFLYHEIISLSSKEDGTMVTDIMLNDLARHYIKLRGEKGVFLGAVHRNTDSAHLHLMSGGSEFKTGLAFRLSHAELQNLKQQFQEYQKKAYPELIHSLPKHGQNKEYGTDRTWQKKHREERKRIKDSIQETVARSFEKARTRQEFLESLQDNELHYYERKGVPEGIIFEGLKIRFSRLGISKKDFYSLPTDHTEEVNALAEIQRIRTANREFSNKNFEHDR